MDINKIKALYSQCFPEDSADTVELFFDGYLNVNNVRILQKNKKILSELFLIKKSLAYCDKTISLPFITGLCTATDERYKGYAKKLLIDVFHGLKGTPFISLYPFSHEFYEKLGFATVSYDFTKATPTNEILSIDNALLLYNEYAKKCDYYIKRTIDDFIFLNEVNVLDNTAFFKAIEGGYTSGEEIIQPSGFGQIKGVMARLIDVKAAFALSNLTIPLGISLSDTLIPENNFTFTVDKGKILPCNTADVSLDIKELTLSFFGQGKVLQIYFPKLHGHLADRY